LGGWKTAIVERVIDLLTDGKPHSPKEIAETLQIREETVLEILRFLSDFNFA